MDFVASSKVWFRSRKISCWEPQSGHVKAVVKVHLGTSTITSTAFRSWCNPNRVIAVENLTNELIRSAILPSCAWLSLH